MISFYFRLYLHCRTSILALTFGHIRFHLRVRIIQPGQTRLRQHVDYTEIPQTTQHGIMQGLKRGVLILPSLCPFGTEDKGDGREWMYLMMEFGVSRDMHNRSFIAQSGGLFSYLEISTLIEPLA
jgi:hypothetical protein